jgi:hypothetical protein
MYYDFHLACVLYCGCLDLMCFVICVCYCTMYITLYVSCFVCVLTFIVL